MNHNAAGNVVRDSLICQGTFDQRITGGDGKRPKLAGFKIGDYLFQAPRRIADGEFSAVASIDPSFVVVEVPKVNTHRARTHGADDHQPASVGK